MDEILKSLLTQIKTPQTYDEYKTIVWRQYEKYKKSYRKRC